MAAESVLSSIVVQALRQIGSLLAQEIGMAWCIKTDLQKMEKSLSLVRDVILDADEQQFTSREACTWLRQLKGVLLDAEDVLDEFEYEALRKKVVNSPAHGGISKKVHRFFSTSSNPVVFRLKMSHKLKEIREAFDEVAAKRSNFDLNTHHRPNNPTLFVPQRELTHSFVSSGQIIGRDIDRDIDPEQLQKCLRECLCDKRFLLVLDDVWAVSRASWLEFKELLMCEVNGSKVMVTTRNSTVASNMGSVLARSLKGLPRDECVSLFKKFAFSEGEDGGELMEIGKAIVEKCKGVPLAIKTLGCLLFSKRDRAAWEFVRDNEMWQLEQNKGDILPALKISYDMLPFILKQCFISCSLFPKDHEFWNEELIQNWEAIGLIRSSVKNIKVEDIGQQYIDELCVRGFFQDFGDVKTISKFKMHDLINDLALSVAQNELESKKRDRQGKDMYKSVRHVSFSRMEGLGGEEVPRLFVTNKTSSSCVMPTLWSVFFDRIEGEGDGIGDLIKTCVAKLKHLRIIDLQRTGSLEWLLDSIGALKHLRYVNLKGCQRLKRLPDSVCKLYNLQSLNLYGCLEFEELPKDIGDLVNLKRLELTTKQKRLSEKAGKGIESLSALGSLTLGYCENLEYIFELATGETQQLLLASIQTLVIGVCRSLKCLFPSSPGMKKSRELSDLETLMIIDCPKADLASIFNDHISLVKLKSLSLVELPQMESLPEWINLKGCATTLECLRINVCRNLTSLPEWLHNLTSLRRLAIWYCPKLLCLPDGLHVLKGLEIEGCPELSRRCKRGTGEDWPNIKHIPEIWLDRELQ